MPQKKSASAAGDYRLERIDCLLGMRSLETESIDIVVTSPPYNLDIAYGEYRDDASRSDYLCWCHSWAAEVARILKPDGSFFLNVGASPSNPLLPHQLVLELAHLFQVQNTIHWIKAITITTKDGDEISAGHFKPINSERFLTDCHEYIFHLTRSGAVKIDRLAVGVKYADKSNIARWGHTGGKDLRCRGNTWFIPYKTILNRASDRPHPATFPIRLAAQCIKLHGVNHDLTVLDPFLGLGSSAMAAMECGIKNFIGFEIDQAYLDEARSRIAAELPLLPA
jgi:site-specific DNA-methyltransferase (adenine-specific)